MAINLSKDKDEFKYYYSKEGATFGPFSLSQLLEQIEPYTLVYREGIDWTNAQDVEELKKFFKVHRSTANQNLIDTTLSSVSEDFSRAHRMFSSPFSFNGRIRRMEYGISLLIYIFSYSLISIAIEANSVLAIIYIPLLWFIWAQGAKRCHDRGNSGWYQIVPFYMFWMLFAEGDSHINEYGVSPK